jgi:chorismate mutase
METARQLAKMNNISIFRAGIWKPRTRPNSFEGVGVEGLKWLRRVKQETGLPVATEVANEKHVYEALKHGVDMLWIGARTSVNPFTVQEITEALKGVDVMVFVKNPINPDIELWNGAIERVAKAGIKRLGAIHRGFSTYEKTTYRNQPNWQLPIELRRRIPNLPIICDPSHIAGAREYIYEISQKAMDLNFDGLMIESHINPDIALSDASQQLTPNDLKELLSRLILRIASPSDPRLLDVLGELRQQIDVFDDHLIDIMEQRMKVSETIGKYKKENNITILQSARWDEIVKRVMIKGRSKGLSEELIDNIFKAIHQESINRQMKIMNDGIENHNHSNQ